VAEITEPPLYYHFWMASLATTPAQTTVSKWRPITRVSFRFAFCYLGLYCLIAFQNVMDFLPYEKISHWFVPWVGQHVLHLSKPITYFISGSGDRTSDWVLLFCHLVVSIVGTVVWTILDRRKEYPTLNEWLRVALRYALAVTMFAYGSAKVVKLQFSDPSLGRLLEPLRDVSPMGLLWTFMGVSTPYTFFAGASELLGGVLLFFRRTTTLGALVTAAVMTNVAILNYAYDVPVKLLATHLVLMCGYLLIPDLRALCDFFIRNRPAAPAPVQPHFASKKWRIAEGTVKTLFISFTVVTSAVGMIEGYNSRYGPAAPKSPLYGIWDVEEFTRDGQTLPPLLTDTVRWRRMVTQSPTGISIRGMDDSIHAYAVHFDTAKSTILSNDAKTSLTITWSRPDADHLNLTGTVDGHHLAVRLNRMDVSHTNLLGRGFHWISELPFNR
jgi:uncharacterized membrane protein YphA (DoxX/SURF4 family)